MAFMHQVFNFCYTESCNAKTPTSITEGKTAVDQHTSIPDDLVPIL